MIFYFTLHAYFHIMYPSSMKTFFPYPYGYYSQSYLQINDQITTPQWIYISRPWQLLPCNFNQSNVCHMNETTNQHFLNNSSSSNNNRQPLSIQVLNRKRQRRKNYMKNTVQRIKVNSNQIQIFILLNKSLHFFYYITNLSQITLTQVTYQKPFLPSFMTRLKK